ncbi:MAG: VWA domain-containing protein [Phycisphaerales bacterium]|nr:VWA domain-containing protein [Phycisphaerales bacterium]
MPELGFSQSDQPDVPQPPTAPLPSNPIGTGSGAAREGAAGAAKPGTPEFMGVKGDGTNVVYILDFSGSMEGEKITYLKIELKRSILGLTGRNRFQVILFNHVAIENPARGMLPATKQNTRACAGWVDGERAGGGTNPVGALEIALSSLKPDTIYLLTDGAFDDDNDVFALLARLNPEGKVQVNTIGFGMGANVAVLERIARENRGRYTYIDVPSPATP